MKIHPEQLRLYAVTDRTWLGDRPLEQAVAEAIDGGAGIVQLREKSLPAEERLALARRVGAVCRARGVPFLINDDVQTALAAGADGVHLGQDDMDPAEARALLGPDRIIGVSAHNADEARAAYEAGADYLGSGAAFVTGTKTDARPITRDTLRAVTSAVPIPVVAIGGITKDNLPRLQRCGLAGVAVVSALFAQPDITAAARELRALADRDFAPRANTKRTALTIAGSDSSGGAGIQADLKAMTMNGVFAMSALTALTAQNTTGVTAIQEATPDFLAAQLDAVFSDIYPDAVKIGMVSGAPLIGVIGEKLAQYHAEHIVVDPVMVATSGSRLLQSDAIGALTGKLLPLAELVTPNIPEAEILWGQPIAGPADMERAAREIGERYGCAVLCKGGHDLNDANDLLYKDGRIRWFNGCRIANSNTHGTGCTLSSAIAANLAKGFPLEDAIERAKAYLSGALAAMLDLGRGSGPMDHAFALPEEYRL